MAWRSLSRFCRVYNIMKCKYYASMRTEEQYQQQASERKKKKNVGLFLAKAQLLEWWRQNAPKMAKSAGFGGCGTLALLRPAEQLSDDSGRRQARA